MAIRGQPPELSKLGYFIDDSAGYLLGAAGVALPRATASPAGAIPASSAVAEGEPDRSNGFRYLDSRYPFLHAEQTPDVLGPHFNIRRGSPPNLVLIVVEGLGRSFSGPDAALGSFTPELDKLAEHSLYFENFLAVQGRTFAVLASLLASAPFGDNGLARLGERMPAHDSLFSVLKSQGYWLKFYCGYDSDFDNESTFLKRQGVDSLVDRFNFGGPYKAEAFMQLKRESGLSLQVGPAIPFWLDGIELDWQGRQQRVSDHVIDTYDYVALMDYRDHADGGDGIISHAMDELQYAARHKRRVVIGVEVTPNEIQKVSFDHLVEADLERELALVEKAFRKQPAFAGFAIHHFRAYRKWLGKGAAQIP